jgi:hypothetical protein
MANLANTLLYTLMGQRQQQQAAQQARFDLARAESGDAAVPTARAADEALAADLARQELKQKTQQQQEGDVGYYGTMLGRDPSSLPDWQTETELGNTGDIGRMKALSDMEQAQAKRAFEEKLANAVNANRLAVQEKRNARPIFRAPAYNDRMAITEMNAAMGNVDKQQRGFEMLYEDARDSLQKLVNAQNSPEYRSLQDRAALKEDIEVAQGLVNHYKAQLFDALNYRNNIGNTLTGRRGLPKPEGAVKPLTTEAGGTQVPQGPVDTATKGAVIGQDRLNKIRAGGK